MVRVIVVTGGKCGQLCGLTGPEFDKNIIYQVLESEVASTEHLEPFSVRTKVRSSVNLKCAKLKFATLGTNKTVTENYIQP